MSTKVALLLLLVLDSVVLTLQIDKLSISYDEALFFYNGSGLLWLLIKASTLLFGQNDLALRMPMIFLHILNVLLLYMISKRYIIEEKNRVYLVLFFILLPGVISSSLMVNSAGFIIFSLLLFVYIYQNYHIRYSYILLFLYLPTDADLVFLYLSLIFYALYKKDRYFLVYNLLLFIMSLLIYGIDTHGVPKGYFLDSMGLYAAIFTPLIFIYMVYVLYRRFLTKELDILWFLSSSAFILSLVLSFRQRVGIEHFAPYLILSLPLVANVLEYSYKVRLRVFRKWYKTIFVTALGFLIVNSLVVFFNEYLYLVLKEPKKHFAYKMHIAKPLAKELIKDGITCVNSDEKMSKRLLFYGVTKCNAYKLREFRDNEVEQLNVTISYKDRKIYSGYVTELNNL